MEALSLGPAALVTTLRRHVLLAIAAAGILLQVAAVSPSSGGPKISVVTALLPPRIPSGGGTSARLKVEASGGCFKWSSQRPDLVRIEPPEFVDNGVEAPAPASSAGQLCESAVVLTSVAEDIVGTDKVTVSALDSSTGVELRCEVHLAHIARLEVETSVRRINVDDVQMLTVLAFDEEGNIFSSLEGLAFQWRIGNTGVLNSVELAQSAWKPSPSRRLLAERGVQSDTLLLRGLSTGRSVVSVKLDGHRALPSSPEVELVVAEQLVVVPTVVRMPPGGVLQPSLKVLKGLDRAVDVGGALTEVPVPMPARDFRWHAETASGDVMRDGEKGALAVSIETGRTVARQAGSGRVVVTDMRIENNSAYTMVHVACPSAMRLSVIELSSFAFGLDEAGWDDALQRLLRHGDQHAAGTDSGAEGWGFVRGRTYALRLELLDGQQQPLDVPINFRVATQCTSADEDKRHCPFTVRRQTPNSAITIMEASRSGHGLITIKEAHIDVDEQDKGLGLGPHHWPALISERSFEIFETVSLFQPFPGPLVLPVGHLYKLFARGGSGQYSFSLHTEKQTTLSVSSTGQVEAPRVPCDARIVIVDPNRFANAYANNVTLPVLVRYVGFLKLRPVHSQLQVSAGGDTGSVGVPIVAGPALTPHEASVHQQLQFWNCTRIQHSLSSAEDEHPIVAESSRPAIAGVLGVAAPEGADLIDGALPPAASGVCAVASVQPRAPGSFTLTATVKDIHAEAVLNVFAPLTLVSPPSTSQAQAAVIAVCSSATFQMVGGPVQSEAYTVARNVSVPGEGSHIRLHWRGNDVFDVICLRPTSGPARLTATTTLGSKEDHLMAEAAVLVTCVAPVLAQVVPDKPTFVTADTHNANTSVLDMRRGQAHNFHIRLLDAHNRIATHAVSYAPPRWTLDVGRDGWKSDWLSVGEQTGSMPAGAVIAVPGDTPPGSMAVLNVEVVAPTLSTCRRLPSLTSGDQQIFKEAVETLPSPLRGALQLRATLDFALRWPGHPSVHLPFAPQWAFQFLVVNGTGVANLSLHHLDDVEAQVVQPSGLCAGVSDDDIEQETSGCFKALLAASSSKAFAKEWFVNPMKAGRVRVTVQDAALLGQIAEVVEISFLPASRIDLALAEIAGEGVAKPPSASPVPDSPSLLIVRGRRHSLCVKVWDTVEQMLAPASWHPLQLQVEANDTSVEIISTEHGVGDSTCVRSLVVVPRSIGTFYLRARAHNYATGALYSAPLVVHVFDPFGIGPLDAVVIPTQTFEYSFRGGPAADAAGVIRAEFLSLDSRVASVTNDTGLLTAVAHGSAVITARLLQESTGEEVARTQARVDVVAPASVSIEPDAASSELLLHAGGENIRLHAAVFGNGMRLTSHLLTAPSGSESRGPPETKGCTFHWSSAETAVALWPSHGATFGASAVDVRVFGNAIVEAAGPVAVSVKVACPGVPVLQATREIPVLRALQLLTPNAEPEGSLLLPLFGRVPLSFNQPMSSLDVELLRGSSGDSDRNHIALSMEGSTAELVAGQQAGEALVVARRAAGVATPLVISVLSRAAVGVQLLPSALDRASIPLGARVTRRVVLHDAQGSPLLLPPGFSVSHSVSHNSVLTASLVRSPAGATLELVAVGQGCAAVNVTVETAVAPSASADDAALVLGDRQIFCVSRGAIAGRGPVAVVPGSQLHLSVDAEMVRAVASPSAATFRLRLSCQPGGSPQLSAPGVGRQLANDIEEFLGLSSGTFSAAAVQWAPFDTPAAPGCNTAGVDVDLAIPAEVKDAPALFERLWFGSGLREAGRALRLLDLSKGVRVVSTVAPGQLCMGRSTDPCSSTVGWSSTSHSSVVIGNSEEAEAKSLGQSASRFCLGGVSTQVDVVVGHVVEVHASPTADGTVLATGCDRRSDDALQTLLTNAGSRRALGVPLRFFMSDASATTRELLSGPFHTQGLNFTCQPLDGRLRDFFDFETWTTYSSTAASPVQITNLPALGPDEPQFVCVLTPRIPDVRRLVDVLPPQRLALQVSVAHSDAYQQTWTVADWPFVPQFVVSNTSGSALTAGSVCATLTHSQRSVTLLLWTGGHPVEVSLTGQPRVGEVALAVQESTGSRAGPAASFTVTISWTAPEDALGSEDIGLRLESRASCQIEILRVRVGGAAEQLLEVSTWSRRPAGLGALLALVALLGCCLAANKQLTPVTSPSTGIYAGGSFTQVAAGAAGRARGWPQPPATVPLRAGLGIAAGGASFGPRPTDPFLASPPGAGIGGGAGVGDAGLAAPRGGSPFQPVEPRRL